MKTATRTNSNVTQLPVPETLFGDGIRSSVSVRVISQCGHMVARLAISPSQDSHCLNAIPVPPSLTILAQRVDPSGTLHIVLLFFLLRQL